MKKIILFLFLIICTQNRCFSSETKTYVRAGYGIGKFTSEKLNTLNANPIGNTYDLGFGAKMSNVELGFFFKNFNYSSDINNDGVANTLKHDGKSFGLDMNIFLNNHLSIKLGYSFNTFKQKFVTSVSDSTLSSMKTIYGLQDDYSSSSVFYGAGINIFGSKRFDTTISIIHFPMASGNSATSAQIGFVFYMDKSFADFFGSTH